MKNDKIEWVYLNNAKDTARFALGEKSEKLVACIGINPSTAKPNDLDNTLKSVKRISKFNGFDGWLMYNVYPQRATEPDDLHNEINQELQRTNIEVISRSIQELRIDTIWVAYGDLIEYRDYLPYCMYNLYQSLKHLKLNWKIIEQLTKKGHPKHPLYKATANKFLNFDMDKYVEDQLMYKTMVFEKTL